MLAYNSRIDASFLRFFARLITKSEKPIFYKINMEKILEELRPIAIQRAGRLALSQNKLSDIEYISILNKSIIVKFTNNFVVSFSIEHLVCSDEDFGKMTGINT